MNRYESRPGFVIERIGELMFTPISKSGADFGPVVAQDFDVKVEYSYSPGYAGNLSGAFEDAEEPMPAELTIKAIKLDANVTFDGEGVSLTFERGYDLVALFSRIQIGTLEDKLLDGIEKGGAQ